MNKNKIRYVFASALMIMMVVAMVHILTSANVSHQSSLQSAQKSDHALVCPPHQRMVSSAGANKCEALFPPPGVRVGKLFSPDGLRKFIGGNKREMVYDYKAPAPGKRVMILVHGLGDDFFSLQRIAELAERDGWGILRVDMHGHGSTLENYMVMHQNKLPNELDYRENVDDIKGLIKALNIKNATLVGHSLGGGVSLKVAEELPDSIIYSVHAMAPYIQRIDKFIAQMMTSPDFMIAAADTNAAKLGVPKPIVTIMDPFILLTWQMTRSFKRAQDLSNALLGLDKLKDLVLDPAMLQVLEKSYREYFLHEMQKSEKDLTPEESRMVDLRVEASILSMKGVRGLDFLDALTKLESFARITHLMYGAKDPLVIPELPKAFALRLTQAGIPHILTEITGDKETAGHRFPQMQPDVVYNEIMKALAENSPRKNRK